MPMPIPGRGDGRGNGGYGGQDQLRSCLDNLNRTSMDLQVCLRNQIDPRELGRLRDENENLRRDNENLRAQIDEMNRDHQDRRDPRDPRGPQGPMPGPSMGFFSYAGCKDFQGTPDLKLIASAEGVFGLEAQTNAQKKVAASYSCSYGITAVKTEEIRSTGAISYCVAGCKDFQGNIDQKFIQSGRGRNQTEAEFNALKAVATSYSCSYGIKVQACQ
jgi:hypothetical protein